MFSLSSSSETIPPSSFESTLLKCKIDACHEKIKRVNSVESQQLKALIQLFIEIQNDSDFRNNPHQYLRNWCFRHPLETLAIEKIREVLEESIEVHSACKL